MKIRISKGLMCGCIYDTKTQTLTRELSGRVIPKKNGTYLFKVNGKCVPVTQVQIENYIEETKKESYQSYTYILKAEGVKDVEILPVKIKSKEEELKERTAKNLFEIIKQLKEGTAVYKIARIHGMPVSKVKEVAFKCNVHIPRLPHSKRLTAVINSNLKRKYGISL